MHMTISARLPKPGLPCLIFPGSMHLFTHRIILHLLHMAHVSLSVHPLMDGESDCISLLYLQSSNKHRRTQIPSQ